MYVNAVIDIDPECDRAVCTECGATAPLNSVAANDGLCLVCNAVCLDYVNRLFDEQRELDLEHEETELP